MPPSLLSRLIQSDFTLCFFFLCFLCFFAGHLASHLEEAAFFKGHVKYYWINYGQSRPLQSHIITLEGNCTATAATATAATATIANTANTLRQQSRHQTNPTC